MWRERATESGRCTPPSLHDIEPLIRQKWNVIRAFQHTIEDKAILETNREMGNKKKEEEEKAQTKTAIRCLLCLPFALRRRRAIHTIYFSSF